MLRQCDTNQGSPHESEVIESAMRRIDTGPELETRPTQQPKDVDTATPDANAS